MSLAPGTRLGPYEITAPIGAGGMGEVSRARDTRLGRDVAIKVLTAQLSANPEVRARFEREARTISQLNHPHICTLHDIGHQEGIDYLVMELVEGETLAARLEKGPLPIPAVLRCGVEIASALDAAHRHGVVHRDLKPGNVMLTKGGSKLMDFGLARTAALGPVHGVLTQSPTVSRPLTAEGTIVGTFQYMAPEQLEGKEADGRTDLWALGCVLYEAATGKRAFEGTSQASLIGAIMGSEPPSITLLRPMTPPALDRVVRTCLAKDPADRWQTAHDVMLQLRWIAEGGSQAGVAVPVASRRRLRERTAWIAAAALLVTTVVMTVAYLRRAPEPAAVLRLQLLPPEGTIFNAVDGPATISPDGRRIAFAAIDKAANKALWVQSLETLEARKLEDTGDDAYDPFWSPDSRSLGFGCDRGLMRVDVSGGPVQKITDMVDGRGATWNRDNIILFEKTGSGPIFRVAAAGGKPEQVTSLDPSRQETGHWRPRFLPGGKHFIYLVRSRIPENEGIYIGSLDSKERARLDDIGVAATPALPGYLLYVQDRILMARPFDLEGFRLLGDPFPVARNVLYAPTWGSGAFSVSGNGTLVHQGAGRWNRQLVWFDRAGRQLGNLGEPGEYRYRPRLSPDGRFAAVARMDPESREDDLWVLDVVRGTALRLTSDPAADGSPVWSPDGKRLAFMSNREGTGNLYVERADGSGSAELLLESDLWKFPLDWSPEGAWLLYGVYDPKTHTDLWVLPLSGERKPRPVLNSPFSESDGRFSPDGKYLAYVSDETGRQEVFVQPFPPTGPKWQISTAGGSSPRWRRDGKEILFFQPESAWMVVEIRTDRGFEAGVPRKLFEIPQMGGTDVTADGQRFLVNMPHGENTVAPATVILNWTKARGR